MNPHRQLAATSEGSRSAAVRDRLRIAFVGTKGIPAMHGGIERHVDEIAQRLVQRGHQVDVFTRRYHAFDQPFHAGVRLRRRWSVQTKHLDAATHTFWCVSEAVLSQRYDILHVHGIGPGLFVPPRALRLPTVFTYHAQDWRQRKWGRVARWFLARGESHAIRHAGELIVVSDLLRQYIRKQYGRDATHIPNGAAIAEPQASDRLQALGLRAGGYVLFVGRLIADRGVDTLVRAFGKVRADLQLAIVGEVHLDRQAFGALRRQADDRVLFLGQQTGDTLQQLYAHARFGVHPSRVEGMPIAVLEAMGHGRAMIVSDIAENLEATAETALTFPVGDVEALQHQMQELLAHPERCEELGERARQRVASEFNWDTIAASTEDVYRRLLHSR